MASIQQLPSTSPTQLPSFLSGPAPVRRLSVTNTDGRIGISWELNTEAIARGGRVSTPIPIQEGLDVELELNISLHGREVELVYKNQNPPKGFDVYLSVDELSISNKPMGGSSGIDQLCHYTTSLPGVANYGPTIRLVFSFQV